MSTLATAAPAHRPSNHHVRSRALGIAATGVLLMLLVVTPAHAHAHLLETNPQAGAELDEHPTDVVLTFDEAVEPAGDGLVLTDGDGAAHTLEAAVGPEPGQVGAELPPDAATGRHTIAWRILAADGHVQEGGFSYTVAAPAEEVDEQEAQEAESEESAEPDDRPADDSEADDEEPEAEQDLDAEALGTPDEDDGGAGWVIAVAVLVAAAGVAGALMRGGRRRSSEEEGA